MGEMFEHMKNYELLLEKLYRWLKPKGKLFVHIFTHMRHTYHYEVQSESDWMTKYFFEGGTMPSHDLLLHFQKHLKIERTWHINGKHYARTSRQWLDLIDATRQRSLTSSPGRRPTATRPTLGSAGGACSTSRWRKCLRMMAERSGASLTTSSSRTRIKYH